MIHPGLVSVTFRKLSPKEIVDLAVKAELEAIEWGGDVHVVAGDVELAERVGAMTRDAGLEVASYGSYYRVGHEDQVPFEFVVETAVGLGAPTIRVWAGRKGSREGDDEYRRRVVRDSHRIADWASDSGVTLAYEFHGRTLTDTYESAVRLLRDVHHENLRCYWQPPHGLDAKECLGGLREVLPWLLNVHVFHWGGEPRKRLPLSSGADRWKQYLEAIRSTGRDHYAMLEFVRDDSPKAMLEDAETLKGWLREL